MIEIILAIIGTVLSFIGVFGGTVAIEKCNANVTSSCCAVDVVLETEPDDDIVR